MQFFYDGQIRRYISQVVRVFSNFVVKYGDGTLHRIPVTYGDPDKQVASIMRNNSENMVNSAPRIAVYISGLKMDKDRLADQTFIDKVHIRERDFNAATYTQAQGKNYTVERLMPTPFGLTMKVDIWSTSAEQKLQILEQILVLFNPSLEIQTNDNYLDWTSLSTINLEQITWSSRQVPTGTQDSIDIATLQLEIPIWINPPVKVKHLGVITRIITSLNGGNTTSGTYIEGLGEDPIASTTTMTDQLDLSVKTISDYSVEVYASSVFLIPKGASSSPNEPTTDPAPIRLGAPIDWLTVLDNYPGKYIAGSSMIYLTQANGNQIIGTFAVNSLDPSALQVNWNPATLNSNTGIDSQGRIEIIDAGYNAASSYRPNSTGTFDAIVNPLTYNPKRPLGTEQTDQAVAVGTRFLLVDDIGLAIAVSVTNTQVNNYIIIDSTENLAIGERFEVSANIGNLSVGSSYYIYDIINANTITVSTSNQWNWTHRYDANPDGTPANTRLDYTMTQVDAVVAAGVAATVGNAVPASAWGKLAAHANDIIEWSGTAWAVIFNHSQHSNNMIYQTNIYTGVQYVWHGVSWSKSFDGIYKNSQWMIIL